MKSVGLIVYKEPITILSSRSNNFFQQKLKLFLDHSWIILSHIIPFHGLQRIKELMKQCRHFSNTCTSSLTSPHSSLKKMRPRGWLERVASYILGEELATRPASNGPPRARALYLFRRRRFYLPEVWQVAPRLPRRTARRSSRVGIVRQV